MWPVLLYLFIYLTRAEDVPTDPCHSHHALGLETLIRTSGPIAMAETESIRLRYHKALRYTFSKLERKAKRAQAPDDGPVGSSTMGSTTVSSNSGSTMPGASTTEGSTTGGSTTTAFVPTTASDWNPNCPRPNATMFTVAPPTTNVHFTQPITTPASSTAGSTPEASTTAGYTMTSDSSKTASTQSPPTTTAGFASTNGGKGFQPVPLYMDHEEDLLVVHFNRLHKYVTRPEAACDVQNITTLNDLTEDHLYGFVASLVTTDVGPFCSVCHRMVNEVKKRAFVISALLHDEEQQLMGKIFHSHIPSTKTICSALAPACFEKYEEKVKKVSPGLLCAECSACMTVTNVIQHRLLLNPTVVQSLFSFLRSSLFHNICAELCNSLNNKDLQGLWPNGFQYGACQDWFQTQFNGIIKFVTTLTRPERFCSLELGWCELNEVPNMLQCLPEFCEEFLGKNAVIKVICKLLVGKNQQEAAEFIGVSNTKRYKEKKEYHDQITVHEEL